MKRVASTGGAGVFQALENVFGKVPSLGKTARVALALVAAAGCGAQTPATTEKDLVALTASTHSLQVGDPVQVDLIARHPANASLQVQTEFPPDLVVLSRDQSTRTLKGGMEETRLRYRLTSFVLGDHRVFTGRVAAVSSDGTRPLDVPLTGLVLRVESVLSKTGEDPVNAKWRGYPDPVKAPRSRLPAWIWILPLVAGVALAAGRWARRFGRPTLEPDEPPPSAHGIAMAELTKLRASGLLERGEREPFYVALSAIVRRYLEGRFGLRAPESTTEEFLRAAAESDRLGSDHRRLTGDFLVQSDLVKFARWEPGVREMTGALESAERLVKETAPAEEGAGS